MKTFCLIKQYADEFKSRIKSGEINPEVLSKKSSKELQDYFETFLPKEEAKQVNLALEKKLANKNVEKGIIRWAESMTGVTTEQRKKALIAAKKRLDERKERIFSPEEEVKFLEELVDDTLGIGVSREESSAVLALSKKLEDGKQLLTKTGIRKRLEEIKGKVTDKEARVVEELLKRVKEKDDKIFQSTYTERQKKSIENFINKKILSKKKTDIVKASKIAEMPEKERVDFLSQIVGEKQAKEISDKLIQKLEEKTSEAARKRQIKIVQNFIENKVKEKRAKLTTSMRDLQKMSEKERVDFLSQYFEGEELMKTLDSIEATTMTRGINEKSLYRIKNYLSGENPTPEMKKQISDMVDNIVASRKSNVEYGAAQVALDNLIGDIKLNAEKGFKKGNFYMNEENIRKATINTAGFAKSIVSSIDNSILLRQLLPVLFSGKYKLWAKGFLKSWEILFKSLGTNKNVLDGEKAMIYGMEDAMNGNFEKMKIGVGIAEEAYPTALPEKIPFLGRLFKASQEAFTGTAYYVRAELAREMIAQKKRIGQELTDETLESMGVYINSLTGRGTKWLGGLGEKTNALFFSPKFAQSRIDILSAHLGDKRVKASERIMAARDLAMIAGHIAGILYLAKMAFPNDVKVETDPRSSDFGKLRIGDTRIDMTGGLGSFVVLGSRIAAGATKNDSYKSSITGVTGSDKEFGGKGAIDFLGDFANNKLSPLAGLIADIYVGEDFDKEPYTLEALKNDPTDVTWRAFKNTFIPLPASNFKENLDTFGFGPKLLAFTISDGLGLGTNTYSYSPKWDVNKSVELKGFKEKVGNDVFKKENEEFARKMNEYIASTKESDGFKSLSNEDRKDLITMQGSKLKDEAYKRNGYVYKRKEDKEKQARLKALLK